MSFADKVKKLSDEAPSAGFVNVNFGKLLTTVNVLSWQEVEGVRAPVRVPYKEQDLKAGENIELTFEIGIDEFNPALDFKYTRNVVMKKTSADGKFLADWDQIVLPSLVAVFGADWAKVLTDKKGVYVAAEHADSVIAPKEGKKNYGVPKFIAKFKNAAECKAARDERYPAHTGEAVAEDGEIGIPAAVVAQAKSLLASLNGNVETFKKMMANKPFGDVEYDVDALLAEMG